MDHPPSFSGKHWRVADTGDAASPLRERLLRVRPVADEARFFSTELARDLHDPALLSGMDEALACLDEALDEQVRLAVFGDYDVDGMSGAAILTETLRALGGHVSTVVPSRLADGYGLSRAAVEAVAANGAKVLLTVDCGISNDAEIARAAELGVAVIVCDHHAIPPKLPADATALLHPLRAGDHYPFKQLTGTGVALKLAQALIELRSPPEPDALFQSLLDLAALGTLADLGELSGENRTIVRAGLEQLSRRTRAGVRALLQRAGVEDAAITEEHVGFQLAPRLNAAGRMAHPRTALRLLLAKDDAEAGPLADELEQLNQQRRSRTAEIEREAKELFAAEVDRPAVVLAHPGWSIGILGIVAARMTEHAGRPAVLFERKDDRLVGSARSVPGFDVHAALATCRDLFTSFGGHAQAAGLTLPLENWEPFRERFFAACSASPPPAQSPDLDLSTHLAPGELHLETARLLRSFGPFGAGHPAHRFLLSNLTPTQVKPMGDGSHLRIDVQPPGEARPASLTAFGWGRHAEAIRAAGTIDAAVQLGSSTFRGRERLELRVVDLRPGAGQGEGGE